MFQPLVLPLLSQVQVNFIVLKQNTCDHTLFLGSSNHKGITHAGKSDLFFCGLLSRLVN
jgi:hypothetical protein